MNVRHVSPNLLFRFYEGDVTVLSRRDGRRAIQRGGRARALRQLAEQLSPEELLALPGLSLENPREERVAQVLAEALDQLERAPVPTPFTALLRQVPEFHQAAQRERIPLFAMLELTYHCNLRCRHCFLLDRVDERSPAQATQADVETLLRALAAEGCLDVTLTGGEASLHPHYRELVSLAKSLHFQVTLMTNATTFTAARAAAYASDPAHSTHCSLYGATADVHDAFTNRPGSFARTVEGLRNLAAAGIECLVQGLVWRGNVAQVRQMGQLVSDLGHDATFSDIIYGRLNGDRAPLNLRVSREEHLRLVKEGSVRGFDPEPCGAGSIKVRVEPTGRIAPCELVPGRDNVFVMPFETVWRHPTMAGWSRQLIRLSEPVQENGRPLRACPAMNQLNTGRVEGRTDPFLEQTERFTDERFAALETQTRGIPRTATLSCP
jgi:MoaA/NifB/PqqE/SkfB family radical SAM enzyme